MTWTLTPWRLLMMDSLAEQVPTPVITKTRVKFKVGSA